jgi:hypothetical protein
MRTANRLTMITVSVLLIAVVTSAGAIAAGFLGPGHYQGSFASARPAGQPYPGHCQRKPRLICLQAN